MEGFYLDLNYIIDMTPFDTKEDFDNYVDRLEARPNQVIVYPVCCLYASATFGRSVTVSHEKKKPRRSCIA